MHNGPHGLMLPACVQVRDILQARSPEAMFALRVRVTPYPEGLFSVWIMLAVKYPQRRGGE